jgi:seryl-tRNA synthetase
VHDIKWIREHPADFDRGLQRRGLPGQAKDLLALDERRRAAITQFEQAQARRNAASKEIGQAKAKKDEAAASKLMAEVAALKEQLGQLDADAKAAEAELDKALATIPNLPAADVPDGKDETANVEHHQHGKKRDYAFKPKQHFELGEALGQMDFETAAKISGARFVVLKKSLARLERALGQFMLDLHTTEHGYTEVNPPLLVRDEAMFGTAQLPKFMDDQFLASRTITRAEMLHDALKYATPSDREEFKRGEITLEGLVDRVLERAPSKEDFWLIPTAEVALTNLVRESIVDEAELPMRLTACTPCFRAEAGAAGKHERMLNCAEEVLRRLELPYRVMTLSTGDMGFAAQKTYDIEVWLPGQDEGKGMYREISSCSVCGDFQARRMNARYRGKEGKPAFLHTLNGSGVAVGRALIAVMENYQQENGSIAVPDALAPYMGGIKTIERA